MSRKHLNQKGFTAIEAVLIVIILVITGGTGYHVYHSHKKASNNLNNKTQAGSAAISPQAKSQKQSPTKGSNFLSLDSQQVSFELPSGWSNAKPAHICVPNKPLHCLDSIEVLPPVAKEVQYGAEYGVSVAVYKADAQQSARNWFFDNWCNCSSAQVDYLIIHDQINGYDAQVISYSHTNDTGDDTYYVLKKASVAVLVSFSGYPNQTAGNAVDYISQIKTMVKSLRLL